MQMKKVTMITYELFSLIVRSFVDGKKNEK